jgi:hypothetical protein
MLAEKFFLVLETLLSRKDPDGCSRVVSTSLQVPIQAPGKSAIKISRFETAVDMNSRG